MQLFTTTSFPTWYKRDYIVLEQPFVLCRKYCCAYERIFIHRTPKSWNKSVKMKYSEEALKNITYINEPGKIQPEY